MNKSEPGLNLGLLFINYKGPHRKMMTILEWGLWAFLRSWGKYRSKLITQKQSCVLLPLEG